MKGKPRPREKGFDLGKLRTFPIRERKHLVSVAKFAHRPPPIPGFRDFVESLPDIYAGRAFKTLVTRIVEARREEAPVAFALGAHVIKCGLSPLVIDLIERGVVTAVALNGAGAIHDYEVAAIGETSEDVAASLPEGRFGMVRETPEALDRAARQARERKIGFGRALGELILSERLPNAGLSILAQGAKKGIPVTVHVCVGADTVHVHPGTDGEALGWATLEDFRLLCAFVSGLDGGVWVNVGCAVVLPEVFLKAVAAAINLGFPLTRMTTADLDMIRQYRALTNVVERPPGTGISITGQHEILLPLLRQGVLAYLGDSR
ncbi:MAG TPA: hypothetical protein VKF62_07650 [Planctomycetota bacterium]|nr:hypothetical protein [Planctomycetota bacterium]